MNGLLGWESEELIKFPNTFWFVQRQLCDWLACLAMRTSLRAVLNADAMNLRYSPLGLSMGVIHLLCLRA